MEVVSRKRLVPRWVPTPSLMLVGFALIVVGLLAGNFLVGFLNRLALLVVQLVFAVLAIALMAWVGRYLLTQGRREPNR